jgi:membrane fusion protein (multidrug efflux system)
MIIKQDLQGKYVYVVDQEQLTAHKVYIETGISYKDQTMVTSGLKEGELVIVDGFSRVSDGTEIKMQN